MNGIHEVTGSIPVWSTSSNPFRDLSRLEIRLGRDRRDRQASIRTDQWARRRSPELNMK